METVLNVTLWGGDVAAVIWNRDTESAIIEFYESFADRHLDIAPLIWGIVSRT